MNTIKSTLLGEQFTKENMLGNVSLQRINSNQENMSNNVLSHKPKFIRFSHKIGHSQQNSQNRQIYNSNKYSSNSHQLLDAYLQKIKKSNLDKISQLRSENQREKQNLLEQIHFLKYQNGVLKERIQQMGVQINRGHLDNSEQLSQSLYKKQQNKNNIRRTQVPNPEKLYQGWVSMKQMKEKTEKLTIQVQQYKKRSAMLLIEKRKLYYTIQRLQKQSQEIVKQLQIAKKQQQDLKVQIQKTKSYNSGQKAKKQGQLQKVRIQKQLRNEKTLSLSSNCQQNSLKTTSNEPARNIQSITADKRIHKNLQNQLKERQSQIKDRDRLIDELNKKILSNAVIGLNTKYKYLIKV